MECRNHPGVAAETRCAGCQDTFCGNCLVEISGKPYCGSCKVMTVNGPLPPRNLETVPCEEAKNALILAIVSIFCLGVILGPWAIAKAVKAKKMIAENPSLSGNGKATAAIIIGTIATILTLLGIIIRINAAANR